MYIESQSKPQIYMGNIKLKSEEEEKEERSGWGCGPVADSNREKRGEKESIAVVDAALKFCLEEPILCGEKESLVLVLLSGGEREARAAAASII
jgi:poly(3-hydroxybutyrate) depolymerase